MVIEELLESLQAGQTFTNVGAINSKVYNNMF